MFTPTPSQKRLQKLTLTGSALLLLIGAHTGCRNAAYSDLYVESMASEIRQLEDQLYDYDNEYHILEQELASLKADYQQLRQLQGKTPTQQRGLRELLDPNSTHGHPSSSAPLQFAPRESDYEVVPDPIPSLKTPATGLLPPKQPESILEPPGSSSETRQLENVLPQLPTPKKDALPKDDLEIPKIEPGTPITILPGTPMPPGMPVLKNFSSNSSQPSQQGNPAPANTLELNLSRIEVPNQLASASSERAQLKLGAEKPSDMRIVELAFHPSLSRAVNFDDQSDDDGLYLVLQPKNVEGQLVPTFAALEIVVHDPARMGKEGLSESSRVGRWTYSANEVKSKFQPIGTNQGIHLTLPWNGPDPQADRVLVYVRYTLPDGRQVVNDKTLFVSSKGNLKTVWVPRSDSSSVVTASADQPPSNPTNVIQTQSSTHEPAPLPH